MPEVSRHLLFRSSRFIFHQPDETIDCWFVGADCSGWLYASLLPVPGIESDLDPSMESWGGWRMAVRVKSVSVPILVRAYYDLEFVWHLEVGPAATRAGLFRKHPAADVVAALDAVWCALKGIVSGASFVDACREVARDPYEHVVSSLD